MAGLFILGGLGFASPASANAADSADCPSGYFCVWSNTSYQGYFAKYTTGVSSLAGNTLNNNITSIWNRTSSPWCLYNASDYVNKLLTQSAGGYRADLSVEGIDNLTTSLKSC